MEETPYNKTVRVYTKEELDQALDSQRAEIYKEWVDKVAEILKQNPTIVTPDTSRDDLAKQLVKLSSAVHQLISVREPREVRKP